MNINEYKNGISTDDNDNSNSINIVNTNENKWWKMKPLQNINDKSYNKHACKYIKYISACIKNIFLLYIRYVL
jgi:hypothetical protein